ncbi:MAG: S8 family serine peptidase, partial [Lachnospiraceae bacterium]|nr:S8 family serine peptidase [Lachnospiraceae bacterium]
ESDLVFSGEVKNTGDVVIYSATGDVVIESTNVNVNGLIYAPHGEIRINSMNLNMNNVILIAEKITIEANGINGGKNQAMAAFIGEDYAVIGEGAGNGDEGEGGDNPSVSDNEGEGNEPSVSENEGNVSDNDVSGNDIMEGIVYLESPENSGYQGVTYYKAITSEDDVFTNQEGLLCVKNQLLLMATEGTTFETVENNVRTLNAEIVGYIEATNYYQIEFVEELDCVELAEKMELVEGQDWIRHTFYNYIWLDEPEFASSDPWHPGDANSEWDSGHPAGSNWGIEAIEFDDALRRAGVIPRMSSSANEANTGGLTPVRIGIMDNAFDEWHEDLDDNFVQVWNNYPTLDYLVTEYDTNERIDHGTHVAGIMGAEFNNGLGISGICVENEIWAYSFDGGSQEASGMESRTQSKHIFMILSALNLLITADVKVINYSYGCYEISFAASQTENNEINHPRRIAAISYLTAAADVVGTLLDDLISKGYDFLIVTAAGNANTSRFYRYESPTAANCGYILVSKYEKMDESERPEGVITSVSYGTPSSSASVNNMQYVEAVYNNAFTYIPTTYTCHDYILVVGGVKKPTYDSHNRPIYEATSMTCSGNRVDIYAPGQYIYSCTVTGVSDNNCVSKNGTSMAAPFVTGAVGLAYNVYPGISALELKQIILDTATQCQSGINMLNVADLIREVNLIKQPESFSEVRFHVTDISGNVVPGTRIEVYERGIYYSVVIGIWATDAITNIQHYDCYELTLDSGGYATGYLPKGHYYAIVTSDSGGTFYHFEIRDINLQDTVEYELVTEPYGEEEERLQAFQIRDSRTGEYIDDALLVIYEGWNQPNGTEVARAQNLSPGYYTDGHLRMNLPYGAYTAVISDATGRTTATNIVVTDEFITYLFYL